MIKIKYLLVLVTISMLQSFSLPVNINILNKQDNPCGNIPEMNTKIVTFADKNLKKKVGSGECWDLAAEALNLVGAKWDGQYIYGKLLDPETECIYPGDIIQFEGVKVEYKEGNSRFIETMGHHTAIIYKVKGKGNYELAHQNFGNAGRKVGITDLDLKNITKGKIFIYRPVK